MFILSFTLCVLCSKAMRLTALSTAHFCTQSLNQWVNRISEPQRMRRRSTWSLAPAQHIIRDTNGSHSSHAGGPHLYQPVYSPRKRDKHRGPLETNWQTLRLGNAFSPEAAHGWAASEASVFCVASLTCSAVESIPQNRRCKGQTWRPSVRNALCGVTGLLLPLSTFLLILFPCHACSGFLFPLRGNTTLLFKTLTNMKSTLLISFVLGRLPGCYLRPSLMTEMSLTWAGLTLITSFICLHYLL